MIAGGQLVTEIRLVTSCQHGGAAVEGIDSCLLDLLKKSVEQYSGGVALQLE